MLKWIGYTSIPMVLLFFCGCYDYAPPHEYFLTNRAIFLPSPEGDLLLKQVKKLTLEDACAIAVANNPSLEAAFHKVSGARMRYYQSLGAYSPTFDANFDISDQPARYGEVHDPIPFTTKQENHFSTLTSINASFLIFDGLAREFNVLASKAEMRRSQNIEDDVKRLLIRAVAYAYNDVVMGMENERIYQSDMEFQLANLKYAEDRIKVGGASLSEVLNFKILAAGARSKLYFARYHKDVALYNLSVLMGYPQGVLPRDIEFPPFAPMERMEFASIDLLLDLAIANRPDLQGYRESVRIAEYRKYASYSRYLPTFRAYASAAYSTAKTRYSSNHYVDESVLNGGIFTYGINANYVLFNGFKRYNLMRESQALFAAAQFELAQEFLTVVNEVRAAHANYQNYLEQVRIFKEMLGWVFTQRDLVQNEYNNGFVVVTRLNEAQNDVVNAESDYVNSIAALQKAEAQLSAAIGSDAVPKQ